MLHATGIPPHHLKLKEGAICSLMRNMSVEKGLVKNARVIIHRMHARYLEVKVIPNTTRQHVTPTGEIHCIPRLHFDFKPENCAWSVRRTQFPLRLAYATTFHSCLGLTLQRAVLDVRTPVFAHGQLYTAISRVRTRNDIRLLYKQNEDGTIDTSIRNIVYKELLL